MKTTKTLGLFAAATTLGLLSTMCSSETPAPTATGGTAPTTGGTVTSTGGTAPTTGGTAPSTGGTVATGGTVTTGGTTGGTATGGTATGGTATGGTAGSATGGTSAGGGAGGTSGAGGASGAAGSAGKGGGGAGGGGGMSGGGGSSGGGGKAGGGGGSGGGATGTFAQVGKILAENCAKCHNDMNMAKGRVILLNDAGLYSRLTTAIASPVTKCNDQLLVDKATPGNSLIPKIIQGMVNITNADTAKACVVNRMPAGGAAMLSAANIATITSWVNAGAPQN